MITYYIGVDPSIENTGVYVLNSNTPIDSQKIVDKTLRKHKILRYTNIAESIIVELNKVCTKVDGAIICYEDYSFDSTHLAFTLGELGGVLKSYLMLYISSPTLYLVAPNTLKLFATGHGSATKEMMLEAYPGRDTPSTDVVDAYFLSLMASFIDGNYPEGSMSRKRLEVIKKYLNSKIGKPILL